MKKLLALLMCVFALLIISNQNVYAALVEKEVTFSVSNTYTTPLAHTRFHDTKTNLYDELHEVFESIVEPTNPGDNLKWYDTTIKKGGVSYTARINRRPSSSSEPAQYTIRITLPANDYLQFTIYEEVFTYTSVLGGGFSVSVTTSMLQSYDLGTGVPNSQIYDTYSLKAFVDEEIDPEEGTNITDFSNLPSTIGTLKDASDTSKVGRVYFSYNSSNLFDVYILLNGQQYNLGLIELPGVEELNKRPLSPGIYWTEDNKRFIYYEFQDEASDVPIQEQLNAFIDDPEKITGFRPFVSMNLTDTTYTFTDKLQLYAGYYGGPNGEAYADVVFPFELDDLLSIEIMYSYRWQSLWGLNYTPWESTKITRYISESVDMRNTWQHIKWMFTPLGWYEFYAEEIPSWFTPNSPTIQNVVITTDYKIKYLNNINKVRTSQGKSSLQMEQVFPTTADLYRVYLDTFNNGFYTGYEIRDEIIILDVMYKVDGEVYHVGYDGIDNGGSFGGSGPGLGGTPNPGWGLDLSWDKFIAWLQQYPVEYIITAAIVFMIITWKFWEGLYNNLTRMFKKPKMLLILGGIIFIALYLMGFLG